MRKSYLDNLKWVTVVLVVLYHVIYMYNGEGVQGVLGKITDLDVQYYDVFQYIVYPWFMLLMFIVSGVSARYAMDKQTGKEFIRSRTTKLLVPVTIGLFAFQFIQGYINIQLSGVTDNPDMPLIGKIVASILSGIGVLWYVQMLWLFSLVIVLIKKIDKDRLWNVCRKTPVWVLLLMGVLVYGAGQILNTPVIVCYRFGLYFLGFLLGYFVFSHDEVIEVTKRFFWLFAVIAAGLCVAFCIIYFGENYADNPVYRTPLFLFYAWFGSLAMIGGFARFFDFSNEFTKWMSTRSWGLYVFHYLGISAVAVYIAKPGLVPAWACYLLSTAAGFGLAYLLNLVISRLPFFRWAVLGISKKKNRKA
ncbi:Acyltransferase family protein [Ruminococcaceae bacterium YRB3002]|nr:Acyltransferase family protein [Ruminococcaceae bacterium YRB3002]